MSAPQTEFERTRWQAGLFILLQQFRDAVSRRDLQPPVTSPQPACSYLRAWLMADLFSPLACSDLRLGEPCKLWQPCCIHTVVKLLICFILALASVTISTGAPRYETSHRNQSQIGTGSHRRPRARASRSSRSESGASSKCETCERTASGRIARSATARREFQRQNPCPSTGRPSGACPGYVVDHVQALKHGGLDEPGNMQWQTTAAARAKDKVE